jgi:hypothetical protein
MPGERASEYGTASFFVPFEVITDAEECHGAARFGDARLADLEIRLVHHHAGGETVAVAGGEEDDVDVGAVVDGVEGVAAGADHLVIDVRSDDQHPVAPGCLRHRGIFRDRCRRPRIGAHEQESDECDESGDHGGGPRSA